MTVLLDGKKVRDSIIEKLQLEVQKCTTQPHLLIIQVGGKSDSNVYIKQKKLFGEKIDARVTHKVYEESIAEAELIDAIKKANHDSTIHGVIVQMPLPKHLDKRTIIEAIDPRKDVDGLTSRNAAHMYMEDKLGILPATARGISSLLKYYSISVEGKHVVMVGRSPLVGKPTALSLLERDATVTLAHKHTKNLPDITRTADILIVAIGQAEFITKNYLREGQIVIDVGINTTGSGKLAGDVCFNDAMGFVGAISPVPGGVGPMTVASLFENLVDAYHTQQKG